VWILLAVCSLATALPPALPERGFSFGLTGGLGTVRDDLLAPLRWNLGLLQPTAAYAATARRLKHEAQVALSVGYGANRYGHDAALLALRAECGLAPARGVALAGGNLWPGGFAFYRCHNAYLFSWDDSHLYWMNGFGIGPSAEWRGRVAGRVNAVASLQFALFALAARPAAERRHKIEPINQLGFYFVDNWRRLRPCLPHQYTAAEVAIGLGWHSRRSLMAAGYAFDLLHVPWPAAATSLTHGLWLRWSAGAAQ
jgi:hypothetical protein